MQLHSVWLLILVLVTECAAQPPNSKPPSPIPPSTVRLFAKSVTLSDASLGASETGKVRILIMKNDEGLFGIACHVLVLNGEQNPACVVPGMGRKYDLYTVPTGPYPENNVALVDLTAKNPSRKIVGLYYLLRARTNPQEPSLKTCLNLVNTASGMAAEYSAQPFSLARLQAISDMEDKLSTCANLPRADAKLLFALFDTEFRFAGLKQVWLAELAEHELTRPKE